MRGRSVRGLNCSGDICGSRSRHVILLAFVAVLFAAVQTTSTTAFAEEKSERPLAPTYTPGLTHNPCPPGHKVEFKFGHTSLYVDLGWLSVGTISKVTEITGGACPEGPLQGVELFFYQPDMSKDLRHKFVEWGLPNYLRIRQVQMSSTGERLSIPSMPGTRQVFSDGAVEDVSAKMRGGDLKGSARTYRVELVHGDDNSPFLVGCGGEPSIKPPGRQCTTVHQFGADLQLQYEFRQDRYNDQDLHWPTADGSISEPVGFLRLEIAVRSFIDDLRHAP